MTDYISLPIYYTILSFSEQWTMNSDNNKAYRQKISNIQILAVMISKVKYTAFW